MRIVAIGLGGAGCRIVDSLYAIDRRSSKVACIQGLAVDVDETTLQQLRGIPDSSKLYFPTFDPENPNSPVAGATATIDIAEIISRIHNIELGENDAIFICCGLGGSMVDIVPHVIAGLRASIVEPIFGLVTLPCLAEGVKHSVKAADDIDILSPLLDGVILFDNETWYKKTRAEYARMVKKEKGLVQMLGFGKEEPEISPELATYHLLNEMIVRRISLILKAGEFRADGGIDLAEVVLDSGEVLNTMKGGGFITIGYAVERLPSNPLAFLSQLKPAGLFNEESKKKASRIVDLAKQAIYHEVSTPCDMTSAHKALVLIAGPSHELSMQGFMTVRKWIDRSIRGLETRSGDYPVINTKNVAIIVMLSGLENIPRLSELREIREQARHGGTVSGAAPDDAGLSTPRLPQDAGSLRDEMILLPKSLQKGDGSPRHTKPPVHEKATAPVHPVHRPEPTVQRPAPAVETVTRHTPKEVASTRQPGPTEERPPLSPVDSGVSPHRRIVSSNREIPPHRQPAQQPISSEPAPEVRPAPRPITGAHTKDVARQRIEQELQRQRLMALSGAREKPGDTAAKPIVKSRDEPSEIIRHKRDVTHPAPPQNPVSSPPPREPVQQVTAKKMVIIRKRSPSVEVPEPQPTEHHAPLPETVAGTLNDELFSPGALHVPEPEEEPVEVKDSLLKAKDDIFSGKNVRDIAIPKVRDASLLHTNLKQKKPADSEGSSGAHDEPADHEDESAKARHYDKKTKKHDDISWI